jgi:ElaA protein
MPAYGRIIISPAIRGKGLGRLLIKEAMERTFALWPKVEITIGAQSHLSKMYQSFGFREISEHYLEDDIMHVDMHVDHI